MASAGGSLESGEPEFQLAPLIDVLLVLLIFFMSIASTVVLRYDREIVLPAAEHARDKEDSQGEGVFNLYWEAAANRAVVVFEEKPVELRDMVAVLEARVRRFPGYRILIRGDADVPAIYVNRVMETAARAGVVDITFATLQPGRTAAAPAS